MESETPVALPDHDVCKEFWPFLLTAIMLIFNALNGILESAFRALTSPRPGPYSGDPPAPSCPPSCLQMRPRLESFRSRCSLHTLGLPRLFASKCINSHGSVSTAFRSRLKMVMDDKKVQETEKYTELRYPLLKEVQSGSGTNQVHGQEPQRQQEQHDKETHNKPSEMNPMVGIDLEIDTQTRRDQDGDATSRQSLS